jgi:hypothetical protein
MDTTLPVSLVNKMDKDIAELLQHARTLVMLLELPEPGLFTWNTAVSQKLADIHKFA